MTQRSHWNLLVMHHLMEWEQCWCTVTKRVLSVRLLLHQGFCPQQNETSHLDKEAFTLVFVVTKFHQRVLNLRYRLGSSIAYADCLSRLLLPAPAHTVEQPAGLFMLRAAYLKVLVVFVVAEATSKDPVLAEVRELLWAGKELQDHGLKPYAHRSTKMSVPENCIVLGSQMVIPGTSQP